MAGKKQHNSETIIRNLRQAEVMLHEGQTIVKMCRNLRISDTTYYKWRKEYGGMQISQEKAWKSLNVKIAVSRKRWLI